MHCDQGGHFPGNARLVQHLKINQCKQQIKEKKKLKKDRPRKKHHMFL